MNDINKQATKAIKSNMAAVELCLHLFTLSQ